eukprot:7265895-Prymnesium_polylepis.1
MRLPYCLPRGLCCCDEHGCCTMLSVCEAKEGNVKEMYTTPLLMGRRQTNKGDRVTFGSLFRFRSIPTYTNIS